MTATDARTIQRETELLDVVRAHLEAKQLDVHHEVKPESPTGHRIGRRCDLVALNSDRNLVHAIEGKLDLCPTVLDQAQFWRQWVDFVFVAVRAAESSSVRMLQIDLARLKGVGLLEVFPKGDIRLTLKPKKLNPDTRKHAAMIAALTDTNRAQPGMAGSSGGRPASKREQQLAAAYQAVRMLIESEGECTAKFAFGQIGAAHPVLGKNPEAWRKALIEAAEQQEIRHVRTRNQFGQTMLYYQKENS